MAVYLLPQDDFISLTQTWKLGILKHLDGDTPPPSPPGPPSTTPPPDRGHRSPAIEGPPPHEFQLFFYHGDHLGSSNVITDAFAGVFEHVEYFPFGEPWVDEGGTATLLPYKFTGKELDPETGLYYYGARYYEPRLQRWLSPDALESVLRVGVPPAHNPYQYTLWNPLRFVDPTGLEEEQSWSQRVWAALTTPFRKIEEVKEQVAEAFGKATGGVVSQRRGEVQAAKQREIAEVLGEDPAAAEAAELAKAEELTRISERKATGLARTGLDVAEMAIPLPLGKAGKVGKPASTALGRSVQSLKETLSTGKGPWIRTSAHAEQATAKVFKGATSIEEVFVHSQTGERLIRHTVVRGSNVLHETFRPYAKFGLQ